ncbi:MAG: NERD domain-containing protein [bacterium]
MPTMIPDIQPENIDNEGEGAVYLALKEQLPADWMVRYHFDFSRKRGGKICPDGEVDFIVIIPNEGVLFLEVKGLRNATFCSENGQFFWRQADGSKLFVDDPFAQAQGNKHDVIKMIQTDLNMGPYFQGRHGHAVVFPFAGDKGTLPVSQESQIVLLHSDMDDLENICRNALGQFGSEDIAIAFTASIEQRVRTWLLDNVELSPVAAVDVDDDDRKITALTHAQHEAYTGVLGSARVRVEGVAGSGKTMIALWTAQSLAADGKKVLLLCFNKSLAAWLKDQASGFEVFHFHALTARFCRLAEVPFEPNESSAFWNDAAPIQLMTAIDQLGDEAKYDAILVDEAQDFHVNWWTPVEMMLHEPTTSLLHIFLDPDQAGVYGQGQSYPCSTSSYKLKDNCRNTHCIAQASGAVIKKDIPSKKGMPEGVAPTILKAEADVYKRAQQISSCVMQLLKDGFKPQDIAILSPWSPEKDNCSLKYISQINGIPIQTDIKKLSDWRKGKCFWGSTIKAFKGLEAKVVILTDIPEPSSTTFSPSDLYVGMTRAQHRLFCIPMNATHHILGEAGGDRLIVPKIYPT